MIIAKNFPWDMGFEKKKNVFFFITKAILRGLIMDFNFFCGDFLVGILFFLIFFY